MNINQIFLTSLRFTDLSHLEIFISSYTFKRTRYDIYTPDTLIHDREQAKIYDSIVKVINHIAVVILQSNLLW